MIKKKPIEGYRIDAKSIIFIFLLLIIIITNLLVFLMRPYGFSQGDSWAYGYGDFRNWDQLSFTGNSLRKWPIVLINLILGNSTLQILFQSIVSTIAWSYLLLTMNKIYKNNLPINVMITILASCQQITSWNTIQLSEAYSISLLVLLISFILQFRVNDSKGLKIYFILVFLLFLNTKPSNLISAIIVVGFFIVLNLKKLKLLRFNKHLVFFAILVIAYSILLSLNQSKQKLQEEGFGITYQAAQAVSVISNTNPKAASVTSTLSNVKELTCIKDYFLDKPEVITLVLKTKCLESQEWLDKYFNSYYAKFLISNPKYVLELISISLLAGNSPYSTYGGTISILPATLGDIYFGTRNYALRLDDYSAQNIPTEKLQINAPIFLWITTFFVITIYTRINRARSISNQSYQYSFFGYLFAFGVIIIISTALIVPNEWYRQTIIGQVSIFISTILALADISQRRQAQLFPETNNL